MEAQGKRKDFVSCFFLCIMMPFFFFFLLSRNGTGGSSGSLLLSEDCREAARMFLCDSGKASCFVKMALFLFARS